jgi:hypothetical protein
MLDNFMNWYMFCLNLSRKVVIDAMTTKETMDIIRESPLWQSLPLRERIEAIAYALETVGCKLDRREYARDISDIIGEIYSG